MVGQAVTGCRRRWEWLQLGPEMGEDVSVRRNRRVLIPVIALALVLTACGDAGESEEERAEVVQMLERLRYGRNLARCMAEQFDGDVTIEQLQSVIDARDDLSAIDFELTETMVRARTTCEEDDS